MRLFLYLARARVKIHLNVIKGRRSDLICLAATLTRDRTACLDVIIHDQKKETY